MMAVNVRLVLCLCQFVRACVCFYVSTYNGGMYVSCVVFNSIGIRICVMLDYVRLI